MIRFATLLLAGLALSGCTPTMREAKISESFQLNYDNVVPVKEESPDGAIYSRSQTGFFLGDRRAQRVGDVLTINLNETFAATKSNDAAIDRSGSTSAALPIGTGGINMPAIRGIGASALNTSNEQKFAGSGSANQSNSITGQITVVVTRVYENGNLWVQGQKMLTLNQGEEYVRVAGLVRAEDIKPGNIVDSNRVAQAQISYTGAGDVHDASKQNWFGKFFGFIAPI